MSYTYLNPKDNLAFIHNANCFGDALILTKRAWIGASNRLNGVALKVYLYLSDNPDGAVCVLNGASISALLGFSFMSFGNGMKELIDNGYLVPRTEREYDFYSLPPVQMN